ncbi:hypothetical protein LCGC14_1760320 [marine sediment metagenome]|uniref:Uncharacterized protein n=1 Tax=marine sediment metagenome TaxID=412755 RepID=A0A0F9H1B0_9ZZZZ
MTFLLESVSVDTDGTAVNADGSNKTLCVWGTDFGGGTVSIEGSPDNGTTWILLQLINGADAQFTANTFKVIDRLGQGTLIRATLTSSSGADDVNAALFQ